MSGDAIGVGLIGLGTIGTGVARVLDANASVISQRLGFSLRLVRVADLDLETDRGIDLTGVQFDSDAAGLIADPKVDIVVELIGGYEVARRFTLEAIAAGKHVVTANKALLAKHGKEIFDAAAKRGVDVAFEASVGGGIPILRSMREGLSANRIESLHGIMNGTTNYVLTEMETTGESFDVVLKRAQDLGYAEADPTFDVDGIDAAHKLTLLVAMAYGAELTDDDIPTEGIRGLAPLDFEAAKQFGYRIKLLGIAKRREGKGGEERIEVRVHPTMIPRGSLLANVDGAMNAIAVHGDAVGPTLFYGAGAGEMPTASAVVADLMEVAREIRRGNAGRVAPLSYMPDHLERKPLVSSGEVHARCYLVFSAEDRPGVLGQIATILGENDISIQSVIQQPEREGARAVPVVVLTHPAIEESVRSALAEIDQLPEVVAPTRLVRIEEDM
ncbi:MAG: homoserine dehydrogenase [bacterium]|nr:homoserine dehydrogenase [bacterium]MCP5066442.1 homoserine dehydrogenase [bacterium]